MVEYWRRTKALAPSWMVLPTSCISLVPLSRESTSRASQIAKRTAAIPAIGMIQTVMSDTVYVSLLVGVAPRLRHGNGRGGAGLGHVVPRRQPRVAVECSHRTRLAAWAERPGLARAIGHESGVPSAPGRPSAGTVSGSAVGREACLSPRRSRRPRHACSPAARTASNQSASSAAAFSGLSEACTRFMPVSRAKSPRMEPGAASCGRVAPLRARQTATALVPSTAMATSGEEVMKATRPGKKGLSAWTA